MAQQFPEWLRRPWASGATFQSTKTVVDDLHLHTVCQSAHCPNIGECWAQGTATVMVLGNTCTRNCSFCSVHSGREGESDPGEPLNVAKAVSRMGLKHAVVTTVVRDDLPDGGAAHIAETIREIHRLNTRTTVEVLVYDFFGNSEALAVVLDAAPEVFCHNIETVRRLYPKIRDRRFSYDATLACLREARGFGARHIVKSALMVGHGESGEEVVKCLKDLREAGVEALCIGQYLRPTRQQRAVEEFVHPDRFRQYEKEAYAIGFEYVVSGPFVRSSYKSELILDQPFARARLGSARLSEAAS